MRSTQRLLFYAIIYSLCFYCSVVVCACSGDSFGIRCEYQGTISQTTGGCGWQTPDGVDWLGGCNVDIGNNQNHLVNIAANEECIECDHLCTFSQFDTNNIIFDCYGSETASQGCITAISSCFGYSVSDFCVGDNEYCTEHSIPLNQCSDDCSPIGPIVIGYAGMDGNTYFADDPVYQTYDNYYDYSYSVEAASFKSSGLTGDISRVYNIYLSSSMLALDVSQNPDLTGTIGVFSSVLSYLDISGTGMTVLGIESALNGMSLGAYYANSGSCTSATSCTCNGGYRGNWCSYVDYCYSSPCQHGGSCFNSGSSGYTCSCTSNYLGTSCQYLNLCTLGVCLHGGTCSNPTNATYACNCSNTGYTGTNCSVPDCTGSPCQNGGACLNATLGYTCNCTGTGFNGTNCTSIINNCPGNQCQNGGTCVNIVNGYNCTCPTNFNGTRCQNNYSGCSVITCLNGGVCNAWNYTANCTCPTNFNGTVCQNNYNDCTPNPCINGGICNAGNYTEKCNCLANFNGTTCQNNYTGCSLITCYNGGTCQAGNNTAQCLCVNGTNGTYCENDFLGCISGACSNGGLCSVVNGVNVCNCTGTGYHDVTCGTLNNNCVNSSCQNNSTCVNAFESYTCNCAGTGFSGSNCSIPIIVSTTTATTTTQIATTTPQTSSFIQTLSSSSTASATTTTAISTSTSITVSTAAASTTLTASSTSTSTSTFTSGSQTTNTVTTSYPSTSTNIATTTSAADTTTTTTTTTPTHSSSPISSPTPPINYIPFLIHGVFHISGLSYNSILGSSNNEALFVKGFSMSIALICKVQFSNVAVSSILSGSVIVTFVVIGDQGFTITVLDEAITTGSTTQTIFLNNLSNLIPSYMIIEPLSIINELSGSGSNPVVITTPAPTPYDLENPWAVSGIGLSVLIMIIFYVVCVVIFKTFFSKE